MEKLIEELTKVNPSNLSEDGLELFNKINEIIDRNEELKYKYNKALSDLVQAEHKNKELEEDLTSVYLKGVYDERDKWKSLVEEKIEELDKEYKDILSDYGNIDTDVVINIPNKNVRKHCEKLVEKIIVLQKLLEKRK